MSAQSSVFSAQSPASVSTAKRSRALALLLMAIIAAIFWVDSRYPALMKRYRAGVQIKTAGALTFSTPYRVEPGLPLARRIGLTTLNWLDANRVGMTFGFLFGPGVLAFLGTLARRRSKSRWLNTLSGAVAGAPLGVCTNCVAPIASGMFASGMSTESVLATMFASPTLNVVVLAMTFALFPASIALLKLATVVVLIGIIAPAVATLREPQVATVACAIEIPGSGTWSQAVRNVVRSYAKSFWYVFRVGFPLMLLAALLGATVAELLPEQWLVAKVTFLGIVLVALVSTFLPVPMAFDVAVAYVAMTRGVPMPYVVTILCTAGIVSVYSLAIVGKSLSWKVAGAVYGAVVGLGIIAGLAVRFLV
jgi:uncharacterized membrane protein YraQ (UPF0718 family)